MNRSVIFIVIGMLLSTPVFASVEVRDIHTRPGVTQRLLLLKPARPVAVLVVFTGGEQALGIHDDGSMTWGRGNLLVRTGPLFMQRGYVVVIADTSSDQQANPIGNFREQEEHAQDVAAVIANLRKDYPLPLWLIGTSSGTTSVLNATINQQKNGADGIVLATGISADSGSKFVSRLDEVHVPTLLVRKTDPCHPSPQRDADSIADAFKNAPKVEELGIQPVVAADSDPCKIAPVHGYLGMEDQFVDKISGWIKAVMRQRKAI